MNFEFKRVEAIHELPLHVWNSLLNSVYLLSHTVIHPCILPKLKAINVFLSYVALILNLFILRNLYALKTFCRTNRFKHIKKWNLSSYLEWIRLLHLRLQNNVVSEKNLFENKKPIFEMHYIVLQHHKGINIVDP